MNSENKSIWDEFTNQYSISKTLRFELRPVGKTKDLNIDLIEEDKERALDYKDVKIIIDKYYKYYMDKVLQNVVLDLNQLREYHKLYLQLKSNKNDEELKVKFRNIQKEMRIYLHNQVKNKGEFSKLFKQELIKEILPKYHDLSLDERKLVNKFNTWNTYFTGFYENRKNIFSTNEIPTSIYYRIVHDNLPKFIENLEKFQNLKEYINKGFALDEIAIRFEKELSGMPISVFFSIENFNNLLNQQGIDKFNLLIGGYSNKEGAKIKGLNEEINNFSQQFLKDDKDEFRKIRKLKLNVLFKQILSDRESGSFIFEAINNDEELFDKINNFSVSINILDLEGKLKDLFRNISDFDTKKIYLKNDFNLTNISQKLFKDYSKISQALEKYAQINLPELKGKKDNKFQEWVKKTKYFSIYEIEEGIRLLNIINDMDEKDRDKFTKFIGEENILNPIIPYLRIQFENNRNDDPNNENMFKVLNEFRNKYLDLDKNNFRKENESQILIIKNYLDSIMNIFHFLKPFYIDSKEIDESGAMIYELDNLFYIDFNEIYLGDEQKNLSGIKNIVNLYNQVRNYLTKKSFDTKKFKLNFQNSTLLAGWDLNKEQNNSSVLFRKDGKYYLGIMAKGENKLFLKVPEFTDGDLFYEKVDYKLLPGPDKMLPKVFFSKSKIKYFSPSDKIIEIRNHSSHTKNGTPKTEFSKKEFNLKDCHMMIDFFKSSIEKHEEWREFNFNFKDTNKYNDMSEFYSEVSTQGYSIKFRKISEEYINKLVDEGKLFLFQIYNKDFSEKKSEKNKNARKNLHTIYWNELFSDENLKNIVYKLNGEAEIFYREASLKHNITHPENSSLENKEPIANKKNSFFSYDLVKDKRYTQDKFLFHVPITLNFKANGRKKLNSEINSIIKNNSKKVNIFSIDRGERHLAYWTLINSQGKIIDQGSFNIVSDDFNRNKNFHEKLDKLEDKRDEARKTWTKIENIKELKEGYISQLVHKISKIAIENNAIIVFEDLNFGFKRGRFKIEKQIYQKFEKSLIDKFNFLIFKERKSNITGGSLNAYQLTPKFESFKKLGKQTGIIYYVDPNYTSKICPSTGFINLLYPRYENEKQAKDFLKKFNYIKYNKEEDLFEFNFDYSNFVKDYKFIRDNWSIWSNGIRIRQFRNDKKNNQWDDKEENITVNLKDIFDTYKLNYENGLNILPKIIEESNTSLLRDLLFNMKLIVQLRNSRINSDEDYILSCVKDNNEKFFDSRDAKKNEVKNADANGAYHIGVKGLILIDKIKQAKDIEKLKSEHLKITRDEFVNYVIKRGEI